MKKSVLKVQMFGSYEIEYEGNPVSFERNTTTTVSYTHLTLPTILRV